MTLRHRFLHLMGDKLARSMYMLLPIGEKAGLLLRHLAIEQFRLAIKKDPSYAAAYGGIANAFILRNNTFGHPGNWVDSAWAYADSGIELDKNCAECYKAMGLLSHSWGNLRKLIEYYEKAISINPALKAFSDMKRNLVT